MQRILGEGRNHLKMLGRVRHPFVPWKVGKLGVASAWSRPCLVDLPLPLKLPGSELLSGLEPTGTYCRPQRLLLSSPSQYLQGLTIMSHTDDHMPYPYFLKNKM